MLTDETRQGFGLSLKDNGLGNVIERTRRIYGETLRFHIDRLLAIGQATDEDRSLQYNLFMSLLYVALAVDSRKLEFFHIVMEAWGLQGAGEGITDDRLDDLGCNHYLILSANSAMISRGQTDYTLFDLMEMIPTNLLDWRGGISQHFKDQNGVTEND